MATTQMGLSALLTTDANAFIGAAYRAGEMDEHPLDLSIKCGPHHTKVFYPGLRLIADPGNTSDSVTAMRHVLRYCLSQYVGQPEPISYLRVIVADEYYFFEAGTSHGAFICGGCTLRSGAGSTGREVLESIFMLISTLYAIEIEHVKIGGASADKFRSALDEAWEEANERQVA